MHSSTSSRLNSDVFGDKDPATESSHGTSRSSKETGYRRFEGIAAAQAFGRLYAAAMGDASRSWPLSTCSWRDA